jgi:ankyrin repeat protein
MGKDKDESSQADCSFSWIPFEKPVVFISASRDMAIELDVCRRVVEDVARDLRGSDGLEPYAWKSADHVWTGEKTWQEQIPRPSDANVRAVICLFGERLGEPLPEGFNVPEDLVLPDWIAHPWPEDGIEDKIPLTGTLFEFFDSLPKKSNAVGARSDRLRVYIKADATAFTQKGLSAEDRRYGFEHFQDNLKERREFKRSQQNEYNEQIDWLDSFCGKQFRSQKTPYELFGTERREESLEQLRNLLRKDLGRILGVTPRRIRRDPKGLLAYQPEDWDILFGRDNDIEDILENLHKRPQGPDGLPILLLTGLSGQGKSSVLRAGLVGRIRHGGRYSSYGKIRPVFVDASQFGGRDPLLTLATAIMEQASLAEVGKQPAMDRIDAGERPAELVRRVRAALPEGERLLLAIDQAETVALPAEGDQAAATGPFVQAILELATTGLAWAVLTTPQEMENATASLFRLGNTPSVLRHWLGDPDRKALERIVRESFAQAWVTVDKSLVEDIASQADDWLHQQASPGAVLPLLSLLLVDLVQVERKRQQDLRMRRPDDAEPPSAAPKLADVLDSLGEKAWAELEKRQPVAWRLDAQLARLLRHLVTTVSLATGPSPHILNCPETHPAALDASHLVEVLRRFRLLYCPAPGELRLSHQAVVEQWRRAKDWYEEDREHHTELIRVRDEADRWVQAAPEGRLELLEKRAIYIDKIEGLWISRREDAAFLPVEYMRACLAAFFDPAGCPGSEATLQGKSRLYHALWIGDAGLVVAFRIKIDSLPSPQQQQLVNYENPESRSTPLFAAAANGDGEAVRWLLQLGATADHVRQDGLIPLSNAAVTNNIEAAKVLLGAWPHTDTGPETWTPLMMACSEGHEPFVRLLLAAKAGPNQATNDGWTALMAAAQNGHEAVVSVLLEAKVDPNQANADGATALMWAAFNGHEAVVRLLLEAKVDPNQAEADGWTALMWAAQNGHEGVVRLLLEAKADPNQADNKGWTALMAAAQNGHETVVRLLIEAKADPNQADNKGGTALMWAAQNGHETVVRLLLEAKADPNQANADGGTALMWAAGDGHEAVVRLLLEAKVDPNQAKADPNQADNMGWTALMAAAQNGHETVVRFLIEAKVDPNQADNMGWTALMWAAFNGHETVVRLLIEAKVDPNQADNMGWTALMWAAQQGHEAVVSVLLEAKVDPNQAEADGWTALMWAAQQGHEAVVSVLLEAKVDPNQANADGWTALMAATQNGHEAVVRLLLEYGAYIDQATTHGWTALLLAMSYGHAAIVARLLAGGVGAYIKDNAKDTRSAPLRQPLSKLNLQTLYYLNCYTVSDTESLVGRKYFDEYLTALSDSGLTISVIGDTLTAMISDASRRHHSIEEPFMHDLTFAPLDTDAAKAFLDEAAPALAEVTLSPETTTVAVASLSFYDDYSLYALRDDASPPPNVRYLLHKPGDPVLLNWTNAPIYGVNDRAPIKIEDATVTAYAKFFFHFVRGQLGCFGIVEKAEDVEWLPDAPQKQKDAVNALLRPILNQGIGEDNLYTLTATVLFQNALLRTDIKIAPFPMTVANPETESDERFFSGQMLLCNEELLLEELPIVLNPFPAEAIAEIS